MLQNQESAMTYDEFQASEEKPDKKAKTKAGSKRKRSPSPVEKKVKPVREQKFLYSSVADPWNLGMDPVPDADPRIYTFD